MGPGRRSFKPESSRDLECVANFESFGCHCRRLPSVGSDVSVTSCVMDEDADAPELGEESTKLFVGPAAEADTGVTDVRPGFDAAPNEEQGGTSQPGDTAETTGISEAWRQAVQSWYAGQALVPAGDFDPAQHVAVDAVSECPVDLDNPQAVESAWHECLRVVVSKLQFAERSLEVLNPEHGWTRNPLNSKADIVVDRLTRLHMLDLLVGNTDAIAAMENIHPGSFIVADALVEFSSFLAAERQKEFRDAPKKILRLFSPHLAISFDRLPEGSREAARSEWREHLQRAKALSERLETARRDYKDAVGLQGPPERHSIGGASG